MCRGPKKPVKRVGDIRLASPIVRTRTPRAVAAVARAAARAGPPELFVVLHDFERGEMARRVPLDDRQAAATRGVRSL